MAISRRVSFQKISQLKDAFLIELETVFPVMINRYMDQLKSNIDLKKMVVEKIEGFSGEKLESVLKQIIKKELQFLKLTGALFGCIIGSIQVLINILTP